MKVSNFITRHSLATVIVAALLVVPSFIGIQHTAVDFNVLNYLPKDLGSMRGEIILDKDFGDASSAFLIVENKTTMELSDLKKKIEAIDGIGDIIGADDIVSPSIPREVLPASIRESLYSDKGTVLIVRFIESSASPRTEKAVIQMRSILDKDCYLSGATPGNLDSRELSSKETPRYLLLAVVFVILILGLTMESWLIPFIFLLEVGLGIVYNLGSNVIFGKVSFLTQSLAAVLQLGCTMDFSIFLLHRYD
jgi:uncharacterized protein